MKKKGSFLLECLVILILIIALSAAIYPIIKMARDNAIKTHRIK